MASVFLSYDREDVKAARPIANALEKAGHSVWWDRNIKSGAQYSNEIEEALKHADAVVVLWSEQSVQSAWVRDEAAFGRDTNRLVPALIGTVEPPLGFRQYQTTDLSRWKGRTRSGPFQEILRAIGELGGEPRLAPVPAGGRLATSRPWMGVVGAAIATLIVAGLLFWKPWEARTSTPTVAVAAASQSSSAQAIAQDLFVRLGSGQSGRTGSVQLIRDVAGGKPDLILEVSGTKSAANLVLLRASDRQLLSSQELAAAPGRIPDLMPSLAIASAATVDCAANALTAQTRLPLGLLKDFLHACVRFSSLYGTEDVYILVPQLGQIVRREPRFVPALKLLLLTGAHMRSIPTDNAKPSEQWLRTMVERAKQIDANMPELRLAELQLFRITDFPRRISLVDNLRSSHPDNSFVLGARAEQLMLVGRNNESVEDAERSAMLTPLAPYSRSEYVRTLAFSGRVERAFAEIQTLNVLDDVARNLTETRFRLNLRYGNPRTSLEIFRKYGTSKMHESVSAGSDRTHASQRKTRDRARPLGRGPTRPLCFILGGSFGVRQRRRGLRDPDARAAGAS